MHMQRVTTVISRIHMLHRISFPIKWFRKSHGIEQVHSNSQDQLLLHLRRKAGLKSPNDTILVWKMYGQSKMRVQTVNREETCSPFWFPNVIMILEYFMTSRRWSNLLKEVPDLRCFPQLYSNSWSRMMVIQYSNSQSNHDDSNISILSLVIMIV